MDASTPSPEQRPWVPLPVARSTGALFGAASEARGRRVFHPYGVGYRATLTVEQPVEATGTALVGRPGRHRATVRLSRGLGLAEPLPDVLGIGLRIEDAYGPDRHQDFLLATSGGRSILHFLLLPGWRGFFGHWYSSILLYRLGERIGLVGARPQTADPSVWRGGLADLRAAAEQGEARFALCVASPLGSWTDVGMLELEAQLDDAATERLRLNPWNTGGGIRPMGPLMGLRDAAYRGSQEGRGAI